MTVKSIGSWLITPPSDQQKAHLQELRNYGLLKNCIACTSGTLRKFPAAIATAAADVVTFPCLGLLKAGVEVIDCSPRQAVYSLVSGVGNGTRSLIQMALIVGTVFIGLFFPRQVYRSSLFELSTPQLDLRSNSTTQSIDVEEMKKELEGLQTKTEKFIAKLDTQLKASAILQTKENELRQLTSQNEALKAENDSLQSTITTLQAKEKELEQLKAKNKELEEKIILLQSSIMILQDKEKAWEQSKSEHETLKKKNETLQNTVTTLQTQKEDWEQLKVRHKEELEQLQLQNENLKKEVDHNRAAIGEVQSILKCKDVKELSKLDLSTEESKIFVQYVIAHRELKKILKTKDTDLVNLKLQNQLTRSIAAKLQVGVVELEALKKKTKISEKT